MEKDTKKEASILISTYDTQVRSYLCDLLKGEGYITHESVSETSIMEDLSKKEADILILDFEGINAVKICKQIRMSFSLRYIPIILLVNTTNTMDKIKGIYAGADDYIEKPIQAADFLTRIKASIWRANRDLDANPLTKLPGNVTILKELEKRIKNNAQFCVAYADLDSFKEYNDYYGFEWGDKIIQHTAWVISNALIELGATDDFLGHIGGDDFIFITGWESIKAICEKILGDFDRTISSFYKEEDLKRGYIIVKNREGKVIASPILTISIGVATNKERLINHVGQIIQLVTELKGYAKTFSKSIYVIDRRKI